MPSADSVSVTVAGGAGTLTFDVLSVLSAGQTSASINTGASSTVAAGAISINAFDVRLGPDASLLAHNATADGAISIVASNENFRYLTLPISVEFDPLAATVDIAGSTIEGSSVTITATSEDVPGTTQLSSSTSFGDGYLAGIASSIDTTVNQLISGLVGNLLGGFSPSLVVHKTNALIAIDNATITATSASSTTGVTIENDDERRLQRQAIVQGLSNGSKFAVAVGLGIVESTARTLITGNDRDHFPIGGLHRERAPPAR